MFERITGLAVYNLCACRISRGHSCAHTLRYWFAPVHVSLISVVQCYRPHSQLHTLKACLSASVANISDLLTDFSHRRSGCTKSCARLRTQEQYQGYLPLDGATHTQRQKDRASSPNPSTTSSKLPSKPLHPCFPIRLNSPSALSTSLNKVRSLLSSSSPPSPCSQPTPLSTAFMRLGGHNFARICLIDCCVQGALTAKTLSCCTSGKSRAARWRAAASVGLVKWPLFG